MVSSAKSLIWEEMPWEMSFIKIKKRMGPNMRPSNERWRYNVTSSLIGWVHTQNDPCRHYNGNYDGGKIESSYWNPPSTLKNLTQQICVRANISDVVNHLFCSFFQRSGMNKWSYGDQILLFIWFDFDIFFRWNNEFWENFCWPLFCLFLSVDRWMIENKEAII